MASNVITFHRRDLTQRITLRVRGMTGFGFRLWLASKVLKLGARIAGVGIEIEQDYTE